MTDSLKPSSNIRQAFSESTLWKYSRAAALALMCAVSIGWVGCEKDSEPLWGYEHTDRESWLCWVREDAFDLNNNRVKAEIIKDSVTWDPITLDLHMRLRDAVANPEIYSVQVDDATVYYTYPTTTNDTVPTTQFIDPFQSTAYQTLAPKTLTVTVDLAQFEQSVNWEIVWAHIIRLKLYCRWFCEAVNNLWTQEVIKIVYVDINIQTWEVTRYW